METETLENIIPWDKASSEDFLLFHHIPKTAGTALSAALRRYYGPEHYQWFHGPSGALDAIYEGTELQAVGGHFDLNHRLLDMIQTPMMLITIFREPVERIISSYYYLKNNEKHNLHDLAMRFTLEDIFTKKWARRLEMENQMVRMVSNIEYRRWADPLSGAKDNILKYTFFGLQDDLDTFEQLFNSKFNTTGLDIRRSKKKYKTPKPDELDTRTIDLIKMYNKDDILLYEYIQEVYQQKIKEEWR